ncbi:MAG: hypothetical protein WCJ30_09470 [Deltaproteobacteria bacterium]
MRSLNVIEAKSAPVDTFRFEPDQWLWCLHCQRFFQGRDARCDAIGGTQGCAFKDCDGAGYQVDIHDWDSFAGRRWPKREELRKGLSSEPWEAAERAHFDRVMSDPVAHGIGAALNQEWRRRDAILGIVSREEAWDPTPFYRLDAERLERLLKERFAPAESIGRYAPIERLIAFMRRWPQMRANGLALHPSRKDYRVSITEIECAIDTVPREQRDALVSALETAFGDEADVELTEWDGRVVAVWTEGE